jgi:hypothetical protein
MNPGTRQLREGEDRTMKISMMKACCWLVLLMLPCSLAAQAEGSKAVPKSPREFVQEFYKWYVPKALNSKVTRAWDAALKYKSAAFSHELAQLLREDSAAQAKCEELIGIDFDPFLNTQDPANGYEVGEIKQNDKHYRADIYSVESGKRNEKSRVSADIVENGGHWVFVNFFYSDGGDLLKILKTPRPKCEAPRSSSQK